jgi:hypothetical protein
MEALVELCDVSSIIAYNAFIILVIFFV